MRATFEAPALRGPAALVSEWRFGEAPKIARALSLDVVLGVLAGGSLAIHATGARPPAVWWVALAALAWSVYSIDHLLDAGRVGPRAGSFRHRFHHRHSRSLVVVTTIVSAAVAISAGLLLPRSAVLPGVVLAGAAGAYLVLAQRRATRGERALVKEGAAAVVYTLGIWFVPLLVGADVDLWVIGLLLLHLFAALSNLLVFSVFERRVDEADGHPSLVRAWGERSVSRVIGGLAAIGGVMAVLVATVGPSDLRLAAGVLGILVVAPAIMNVWRSRFEPNERYRVWGDLLFMLLFVPYVAARGLESLSP